MPTPRKYANNAQRQAAYRARCALETAGAGTPPAKPGYRRWGMLMRQAHTVLETLTIEMEAYYDARSDAWKESEQADNFVERMESIEEMVTQIRDLL